MQLGIKTMHGAKIQKPPFLRIYASQCVVLVCISTVLLFADRVIAYSSLLGGIISIGPNIYFARLAFRFTGASAANDVTSSLYVGEVGKFVLTAVLFACVFVLIKPLSTAMLFTSFIFMTALNLVLVLRMSKI